MRSTCKNRAKLFGTACVLGAAMTASNARAATIVQIMNFGTNPSGIAMYLYTPTNVVAKPPILVGVHACHGKGLDVCSSGNPFAQQADRYGFLLICPSAVSSDGCWDVHSTADLTHNGGGDAAGIVSMVDYVVQNRNGDANRVYAAGHSSGGMMTNVLLGSYPDVFKAGAAFAGVPFACFAQGSVDSLGWSSTCANGNVTMSSAQWGALVRAAYPGFAGSRPRIQLWHGTVDATVSFHNFGEEIKEWTNVLAVSEVPISTENNALQATWIRTRYADSAGVVQVEAIQETGQPHNLVVNGAEAIHFFGLDGSNPIGDAGVGGARDAAVNDGARPISARDAASDAGPATSTGGMPPASDAMGAGGAPAVGGSGGAPATGGGVGNEAGSSSGAGGAGGGSTVPDSSRAGGSAGTSTVPPDGGGTDGSNADGGCSSCSLGRGAPSGGTAPSSLLWLFGVMTAGWRRRKSE